MKQGKATGFQLSCFQLSRVSKMPLKTTVLQRLPKLDLYEKTDNRNQVLNEMWSPANTLLEKVLPLPLFIQCISFSKCQVHEETFWFSASNNEHFLFRQWAIGSTHWQGTNLHVKTKTIIKSFKLAFLESY